jgi:8-oxo-dGTP diphosphatase
MLIWILVAVLAVYIIGYLLITAANYRHNKKIEKSIPSENKLINDQNGAVGQSYRYGLYKARHNACEAISVHNIKVIFGIKSTLYETINQFQLSGLMVGWGFFGSNVLLTGLMLKKSRLKYIRIKSIELNQPGKYIISYWNPGAPWKGIHTVAFETDGVIYKTYNLHGSGNISVENPKDYASNYIIGYRITGRTDLVDVSAAFIKRADGRVLLAQRGASKSRPLKWEFVGGKLEAGETGETALVRECREELKVDISVKQPLAVSIEEYPDIKIRLTLYECMISSGEPTLTEHADIRWVLPEEISGFDLCPADRKLIYQLKEKYLI